MDLSLLMIAWEVAVFEEGLTLAVSLVVEAFFLTALGGVVVRICSFACLVCKKQM